MTFIKNLWNKVKSFFSNLFSRKAEAKIEATVAPVTEVAPAVEVAVETNTEAVVAENQEAKAERIHALFNNIMGLARFRNYDLAEAFQAAREGDEAALVRIHRAMDNKTYKAPKHNRNKQRKAA